MKNHVFPPINNQGNIESIIDYLELLVEKKIRKRKNKVFDELKLDANLTENEELEFMNSVILSFEGEYIADCTSFTEEQRMDAVRFDRELFTLVDRLEVELKQKLRRKKIKVKIKKDPQEEKSLVQDAFISNSAEEDVFAQDKFFGEDFDDNDSI